MAGSRKNFVYSDDLGNDYALGLDESNTEAINGGVQDLPDAVVNANELPRNIRPRSLYYANGTRSRTIRCVALTQSIYAAVVNGGVPTIVDPIANDGSLLGLIRARGEFRRIPFGADSGLLDGDQD